MNPQTPIAENHIRITRALFDEGMRAAGTGEYKKSVRRLILVLSVIFAAAALWLLYTGGSLIFLLGECIFLGALLFWLVVMLPGSRRRSGYKAMKNGTDETPERTVRFYEDHMVVEANGGKSTTIAYNDILGRQETKHLYIVTCRDHVCVLLDKDGFTGLERLTEYKRQDA